MPNWCSNHLYIFGSYKELAKFEEFAQSIPLCQMSIDGYDNEEPIDFNKFIPYPAEFVKKDMEYDQGISEMDGYNHGGYTWCVNNWGTTRTPLHCDGPSVSDSKRSMKYDFDTAWSPPVPVVFKMSQMFPKLRFHLDFAEEGCAFQGKFYAKAGKVIRDETSEYQRMQRWLR